MIRASGRSKSRLAKAAGAEPCRQRRNENLHAAVARRTFSSQNVQNTSASHHFWKLRCQKMARLSSTKHICKSKCTRHSIPRPFIDVKKLHAAAAQSTFASQNVHNTPCSDHFLKFRLQKLYLVSRSVSSQSVS